MPRLRTVGSVNTVSIYDIFQSQQRAYRLGHRPEAKVRYSSTVSPKNHLALLRTSRPLFPPSNILRFPNSTGGALVDPVQEERKKFHDGCYAKDRWC